MLKRGYIILLIGTALVVIGITITAAYGIGIASVILSENIIIADVLVDPSDSVNRTLGITNIERPVSIALHVEPVTKDDNNTNNPGVEQTVINPNGFTINKNQFGGDGQSDRRQMEHMEQIHFLSIIWSPNKSKLEVSSDTYPSQKTMAR